MFMGEHTMRLFTPRQLAAPGELYLALRAFEEEGRVVRVTNRLEIVRPYKMVDGVLSDRNWGFAALIHYGPGGYVTADRKEGFLEEDVLQVAVSGIARMAAW